MISINMPLVFLILSNSMLFIVSFIFYYLLCVMGVFAYIYISVLGL